MTGRPTRVYLADDEPIARATLRGLLARHPGCEVVGEGAGAEALSAVRALRPDLLFLDVAMPGCDGFELLGALGETAPRVIFVTAYDQHALRAFEVHALDYLLKPFTDARFDAALLHALAPRSDPPRPLEPSRAGRLIFRDRGHLQVVACAEIDWIEAADYYASVHVGAVCHLVRESLNELERRLDSSAFVRVHRSAIVNLARVDAVEPARRGDALVVLKDGTRLRLSRNRRDLFERALGATR